MRFYSVGEKILLTLWVGSMWAIGYIAAPTLFAMLDDRMLAGTLAGQMFAAISYIGLVCGGVLLSGKLFRRGKTCIHDGRTWVLLVMLIIVVVGQFVLQPMMAELRAIGIPEGSEEAVRFGRLHGAAAMLYLVNSLLGLMLVVFGIEQES